MPRSSSSRRAARYWLSTMSRVWRKTCLNFRHLPIVPAELVPERRPRDEGGLARVDAVQALRQPCNRYRGPWRCARGRQSPARQAARRGVAGSRSSRGSELTVEGHRTRCRSSFGNQRSNAADDVRIDLPGLRLAVASRPRRISAAERRESWSLTVRMLRPSRIEPEAADEGCEAVLDLDFRRAGAQRFGVEMGKDQPGLGPEGQAERERARRSRVQGLTGLDLQMRRGPCIRSHIRTAVARIPVGQAGLAEHRMLEEDRVRIVGLDLDRRRGSAAAECGSGASGPGESPKRLCWSSSVMPGW